jgi:hypothetical protein
MFKSLALVPFGTIYLLKKIAFPCLDCLFSAMRFSRCVVSLPVERLPSVWRHHNILSKTRADVNTPIFDFFHPPSASIPFMSRNNIISV